MSFLVDSALSRIDLDKEIAWFKVLARLADHWDELKEALPAANDIGDVMDLVLGFDNVRTAIEPTLRRAGVDTDELQDIVGKVRQKYSDAVPPKVSHLLAPVSQFRDLPEELLLNWKLLSLDESRSGKLAKDTLGFNIGLASNAILTIEPGDRPEFDDETFLLRIGVKGDVAASVGLAKALKWGPIKASAGADASGSLTYWFNIPDDAEERLLRVVANNVGDLCNPFQLQSVADSIAKGLSRLRLKSSFELKQALEMQFNVAPMMGVPRITESTISFAVSATRTRQFEVEVFPSGPAVEVRIARSKVKASRAQTGWSLGIDVSDIALSVKQFLGDTAEEISQFKEDYGDFLSPGTWLKNEADEILAEFANKLSRVEAKREDLKGEVVKRLDGGKALIGGEINDLAAELSTELGGLVPGVAEEQISDAAKKLLTDLSSGLIDALEARVQETIANGEQAAAALFGRIDKVRETLELKIDNVATTLDNATERLRQVISKLEDVIGNLTKALEKAATAKLQLRLWHEETLRRGLESEVALRFTTVNAETDQVYRDLLKGDVERLGRLFSQGVAGIEVDEGQITEFLERGVTDGIEISLLGFEASEQTIFKSGAQITTDKDGNVMVHSSSMKAREIRSPWAAQKAAFASQFQLWSAKESGSGSLAVSATQEDKSLTDAELVDLLDDLVRVGLITQDVVTNARAVLAEQAQRSSKLRASVDLRLAMLGENLELLLKAGTNRSDRDTIDRVLEVIQVTGIYKLSTIDRAARKVRDILQPRSLRFSLRSEPPARTFEHFQPIRANPPLYWEKFAALEFAETHVGRRSSIPSDAQQSARQAVRIHHMVKGYGVLLRLLGELADMDPNTADVDSIDEKHRQVSMCLRPWLKVSRRFFVHPQDELHENALAFLVLLAMDADLPLHDSDESAVSVAMTFEGEEAPVLVV